MTDTDCPRKQAPPAAQTPPLGRPLVYSGRRPGSPSDPRRLQSNATPTTAIPKPTTSDTCRPCPLPPKEKIRRSQRVPSTASNRQPRSTNDAPRYRSIESRTLPSTGSPDRGFSDLLRLMRFDSERPIRPAQSITHGGCGRPCMTQRDAARGRDWSHVGARERERHRHQLDITPVIVNWARAPGCPGQRPALSHAPSSPVGRAEALRKPWLANEAK